jgi:hypothetical protein
MMCGHSVVAEDVRDVETLRDDFASLTSLLGRSTESISSLGTRD